MHIKVKFRSNTKQHYGEDTLDSVLSNPFNVICYATSGLLFNGKKYETFRIKIRSSRSQMFFKIGSQKFYKFHRKTPVLESLFNKGAGLSASRSCNPIKNRLQYSSFSVNVLKFSRTLFLMVHLRWLLLTYDKSFLILVVSFV